MTVKTYAGILFGALIALAGQVLPAAEQGKGTAAQLSGESRTALNKLYAGAPAAKALGEKAVAILVFPSVTKAGFMVGGQYGEGTLFKGGKTAGYYSTAGVSYGLQAGAQRYGYAIYAFIFSQKGLMAGLGLQGNKITRIKPK